MILRRVGGGMGVEQIIMYFHLWELIFSLVTILPFSIQGGLAPPTLYPFLTCLCVQEPWVAHLAGAVPAAGLLDPDRHHGHAVDRQQPRQQVRGRPFNPVYTLIGAQAPRTRFVYGSVGLSVSSSEFDIVS